ncbi:hypothetical protein, partial [Rhizobium johnstonii]|uniref:hypothetical protein n=1 Tax=Rhizobium johnstonii TaxID=3019933 RepID=UPI003F99D529
EITHYPLHMMQGYEVSLEAMMLFLEQLVTARDSREPALQAVSKHRRRHAGLRNGNSWKAR